MRNGLAVLLFASVAVTVFVSPGMISQGPRSVQLPQGSLQADAYRLVQPPPLGFCEIKEDPLCTKCDRTKVCPTRELLETIEDFFGTEEHQDAVNADCGSSKLGSQRVWGVPVEAGRTMRFVLAIVPDPAHTHLSLFFDRQVEAIQQAVQGGGYNFARANMPWSLKDYPETSDLRSRLLQHEYLRNREKIPGLMIFRKTTPNGICDALAPLFVFVVGETPTGGINKGQFVTALTAIKDIRTASAAPVKPLNVMGPTFSGSLYSLMFLLRQMPRESFSYTVIHSGTASAPRMIAWFNNFEDPARPNFIFRTFQESDCYAMAQLTAFLREMGHRPGSITLLSEDESAYGEEFCGDSPGVVQIHFPREISALRNAYQQDTPNGDPSKTAAKLPARSMLRSHLEDNGNDEDSVAPYSRIQTPLSEEATLLGIVSNLQSHHSRWVVIRATNPLDSLFLGRYLRNAYPEGRIITIGADLRFQREIEEPKLRGILALTPYPLLPGLDDHIAVPSGVSQESHNHQVFPSSLSVGTFNAMLSLLSCDRSGTLKVASTRQTAAPAHTALESARFEPAAEDMRCEKLPIRRYAGYGWPILARSALPPEDGSNRDGSNALVAPLWLTGLGGEGYWPVAILEPNNKQCPAQIENDPEKAAAAPKSLLKCLDAKADWLGGRRRNTNDATKGDPEPEKARVHSPLEWKTLFWLGITAAIVFLFLMWKGSLLSPSETSTNFAPLKYGAARNLVFFVTDLLLLLLLLTLSWPWILWGLNFGPNGWSLWIGAAIIIVIVVAFIDLRRRGSPTYAWWFLGISVVAVALSCFLARFGHATSQNFMMYRLIHINSGLSPLVPLLLLLAAGLWWAWYTLGALALLDQRRPRLPRLEDLKLAQNGQQDCSRRQFALNKVSREENHEITQLMKPNSWSLWLYAPPTLFILLAGTAVEFWHPVKSLEAQSYDLTYGWLLAFIVYILILGLSRLALVWLELRNLLSYLDQFPLRRGFGRLDGFTWRPIWRLGSGALQDSSRLISRQFDSLDHLWNNGTDNKELADAIADARTKRDEVAVNFQEMNDDYEKKRKEKKSRWWVVNFVRDLFEPQPKWVQEHADRLECLQKQLATTCGSALKYLSQVWKTENGVDMFEVSPKEEVSRKEDDRRKAEPPNQAPATQLAEQFVCLFYLNFILSVIFRMRTLVMSAAGIYVFALFSFSSYPFEPRSSFHVLMVILFFLVAGTVGIVLAQMHRNGTLSRITKTVPGELGIDFWLRLSAFVSVPLLSLIAAQFPEVSNTLASWLESLQSFK